MLFLIDLPSRGSVLGDEPVTVRPARPEDAGRIGAYIQGLSFASRYTHFLGPVNELAPLTFTG